MSHARASFAQKSAAQRTTEPDVREGTTQYELQLMQLAQDKNRLSQLQSIETRAALKKELIGPYLPWVEGVLQGDHGVQDDVLMTMLVWACDIGDLTLAVRIAEYAIRHNLAMPDQYKRTTATVIAEEAAEQSLKALKSEQQINVQELISIADLVAQQDMPDQVRAKLCKAIGYALRADKQLDDALPWLKKALEHDGKSGVKRDIELLERDIKKNSAKPKEGNG